MKNDVAKLAYDAAMAGLKEQDATLGNLRNRATSVVATASIGTSVATSVGLLGTDPRRGPAVPEWGAWALLLLVVAIGACSVFVLWPIRRWAFGVSPAVLLAHLDVDEAEVREDATRAMVEAIGKNSRLLQIRARAFQTAIVLMVLQVVTLLVALLLTR